MKILNTKITSVENLSGENFRINFQTDGIAADALPGQFVEISTGGATLLNKPISISDVAGCATARNSTGNKHLSENSQSDVLVEEMSMTAHQEHIISLVIKNIGTGTAAISEFVPGNEIKIIGPCGNAFPKPPAEAILVGGGVGIPPLYFMAKYYPDTHFTVIAGAGTGNDIVLDVEFEALENVEVVFTTDDGTKGSRGTVIPELKRILETKKCPVYSCGPKPMLSAVAKTGKENNVAVFVSLEAYMGCGIGVCMGCVVPTVRGMERVCKEGPVFLAEDILWEKL